MSCNNVVPAWALFPVVLKYVFLDPGELKKRNEIKGFNTKKEAEWFVHNEGDHIESYEIICEENS